jgi:hypothetical protein
LFQNIAKIQRDFSLKKTRKVPPERKSLFGIKSFGLWKFPDWVENLIEEDQNF